MGNDTVTGGCLCGRVRYAAVGRRLWVAHCHCATCRKQVAGAVATFIGFRRDQVRLEGDEPGLYASSPDVERGFCRHCGTPLFYRSDRHPGEIHLLIGTLDRPQDHPARAHVFFAERLPWFDIADDLPRYVGTGSNTQPDWHGTVGPVAARQ